MSKEPTRNVYVGHRYVPKIMGEWDKTQDYEGLSIVTHQGGSYTSKKRVPVGIDILNEEFWVITGNYDAQVEYYRRDVSDLKDGFDDFKTETNENINDFKTEVNNTQNSFETATNQNINDFKTLVNNNQDSFETATNQNIDDFKTETNQNINDLKTEVTDETDDKVNEKSISITYFGAIGDGVHDNTTALQEAIDYLSLNGGGELFIPAGDFLLNDEIILKTMVNIKGIGRPSRLIINHEGIGLNILKRSDLTNHVERSNEEGGYVEKISLITKDDDQTGTGIKMNYFDRGNISKVYIRGFEKGIDTSGGSWSSTIDKCYMHNCIYGIYLYGTDTDYNDPRVSGKTMIRTGFNGGSIRSNEIHGNYYGIYFEAHTTASQLHSHGVWVENNIIEGNFIRAIRHTFATGTLHIGQNYFEKNSHGLSNPIAPHISPTIDVELNPDYDGDINNVRADILLDSNAIGNFQYRSGKVIIESSEATESAPVLIAMYNPSNVTIKDNRVSNVVGFFQRPDLGTNVTLSGNTTIDAGAPLFINTPLTYIDMNESNNISMGNFAARGYRFSNKPTVSPEEDLSEIPNDMNYFGVVRGSDGYPGTNGSIIGYKLASNNYRFSYQLYVSSGGTYMYRRYALSSTEWSEWLVLGGQESWVTTATRPENVPNGYRIFDSTLNMPLWNTSHGWRNANGELVE